MPVPNVSLGLHVVCRLSSFGYSKVSLVVLKRPKTSQRLQRIVGRVEDVDKVSRSTLPFHHSFSKK